MLNRSESLIDGNGSQNGSVKRRQLSPIKQAKERVKVKALADYKRGESLNAISVRYGMAKATISIWAKNAGLERRPQGCRPSQWPDENDWEIVKDVKAVVNGQPTLDMIGAKWQMTRAGIHRIYQRWKDWQPRPPFAKNDKIRFMGRDYEVVKPDLFSGLVKELKTGVKTRVAWKQKVKIKRNSAVAASRSRRKRSEWVTYVAVKI